MKKLDINRDKVQPSDEDLLRHQNFEEVLKKANLKEGVNTGIKTSRSWWFFGGSLLLVLVVVVVVFNLNTNNVNADNAFYVADNQEEYLVEKLEAGNFDALNNVSDIEIDADINDQSMVKHNNNTNPASITVDKENAVSKPINYYYPKEASTLTFTLEESFGLKSQYKKMPEFAIYDNLVFQPIGEYQKGWLKANWSEVELIKKGESYFLLLKKNGTTFVCEVVPVFESEDFVKALDVYANAKNM